MTPHSSAAKSLRSVPAGEPRIRKGRGAQSLLSQRSDLRQVQRFQRATERPPEQQVRQRGVGRQDGAVQVGGDDSVGDGPVGAGPIPAAADLSGWLLGGRAG